MATERLSMRKTREILRQKLVLGRSHREVAESLSISAGVVGSTASRAKTAELAWADVEALTDARICESIGVPAKPPPVSPARSPPQRELHFPEIP